MLRNALSIVALTAVLNAAAMPVLSGEIPQGLRGLWGVTSANCANTSAPMGLVEVTRSSLNYPKAKGVLTDVISQIPTRIVGDFAFEGDGRKWHRQMVLGVHDEGKTLITRGYGPGAIPGAERYTRCP